MAELKTRPHAGSVTAFLDAVDGDTRRKDCYALLDLMSDVTKSAPEMWGSTIVGFGRYRYRYASGREGEWMLTGFSPRKRDLTVYILPGLDPFAEMLDRLGKFRRGKGCLYLKTLADVDVGVMRELVRASVEMLSPQRVDE